LGGEGANFLIFRLEPGGAPILKEGSHGDFGEEPLFEGVPPFGESLCEKDTLRGPLEKIPRNFLGLPGGANFFKEEAPHRGIL